MSKSHLTPTTIVDKNNKTTTVYTKPAQGTNPTAQLPAPTAPTDKTDTNAKQIEEVVIHVAAAMDFDDEEQLNNTREIVESYPPDLISELVTKAKSGDLGFILCSLIWSGDDADKVRDGLCFVPWMQTDSSDLAYSLLRSIHHYPQLPQREHYHDADEKTITQCHALIAATEVLDEDIYFNDTPSEKLGFTYVSTDKTSTGFISDPTIVELIMEHPDKAHEIADLVIERKIGQASVIAEIINSSTPALAEGTL